VFSFEAFISTLYLKKYLRLVYALLIFKLCMFALLVYQYAKLNKREIVDCLLNATLSTLHYL